MTNRHTQGQIIRDWLNRKDMSIQQFQRLLDIKSYAYVYRVVHDKALFTNRETIAKAAQLMGIHPDILYHAAHRPPHDVLDALNAYPEDMTKIVRIARSRLEHRAS